MNGSSAPRWDDILETKPVHSGGNQTPLIMFPNQKSRGTALTYPPIKKLTGSERDDFLTDLINATLPLMSNISSQTLGALRGILNDWESIIMQKGNLLKFDTISQGDDTLVLNVPIEVVPMFEDGEYFLSIPELNIYISAPNLEDAVDELKSDMIWLWREYVAIQDQDFSLDAKQLRDKLLNLVKEVR